MLIVAVIVVFVVVLGHNHSILAGGLAINVSGCVGGPRVKPSVVAVLVHVFEGIVVVVVGVVVFVFVLLAVVCVIGVVSVVGVVLCGPWSSCRRDAGCLR